MDGLSKPRRLARGHWIEQGVGRGGGLADDWIAGNAQGAPFRSANLEQFPLFLKEVPTRQRILSRYKLWN